MKLQQRIKERLRANYPKANLSSKRLDAIAAKLALKATEDDEDSRLDEILSDYNDVLSFEEIARNDDRIRTLEQRKPQGGKGNDDDPDDDDQGQPEPGKGGKDAMSTILTTLEGLRNEIAEIKTGKIVEQKSATARKLFESSDVLKPLKENIKENWIARINVNSETPIEDQIKALEEEYQDLAQTQASQGNFAGAPPAGTPPKADDAIVNSIVGKHV